MYTFCTTILFTEKSEGSVHNILKLGTEKQKKDMSVSTVIYGCIKKLCLL
jgi:hypothetical protein